MDPTHASVVRTPICNFMALAGVIGVVGVLLASLGCSSGAEKAAAEELKALGALVVIPDGTPTSVALATGKDVDLEKAMPLIAKLRSLDSLNASNTQISDEQLKYVGQLKSLGDLQLSDTPITDAGIKHISGLNKLSSLYISGTKVTSNSLPEIGKLKKLKGLGIYDTAISGGFEPLIGLEELVLLVAGKLKITEEDAKVLVQIPNLRRIDLTDGDVSEEALAILRDKIPQVAAP